MTTNLKHNWTPTQVAFLTAFAWDTTSDFILIFRDTFGRHADDLSDDAIRGKRQHLRRPELNAARKERKQLAAALIGQLDVRVSYAA